jgi:hypothetical protein
MNDWTQDNVWQFHQHQQPQYMVFQELLDNYFYSLDRHRLRLCHNLGSNYGDQQIRHRQLLQPIPMLLHKLE